MLDLAALVAALQNRQHVGILTHNHPDPDALAAAFGLKRLIAAAAPACTVAIRYRGIIARVNNATMLRVLGIPAQPLGPAEIEAFDALCTVDCQPGHGHSALPVDREALLVVDHHPAPREPYRARFVDVRPDAGSSAAIVAEYLERLGVAADPDLATALYYGIHTDTDGLSRGAGELDRRLAAALLPLADPQKLHAIEKPRLPRQYFRDLARALQLARVGADLLVSDLGAVWCPEMPAEMADLLVRLAEVSVALVLGSFGGQIHFSLRTTRRTTDLADVAMELVQGDGTAGGHNRAAGGQLPERAGLGQVLFERFAAYFGVAPERFAAL